MLQKPIGNIFVDRIKIHEQCSQLTGKYDAARDILSRPPLPESNFTELNSHSFLFEDNKVRPLIDIDKLWAITNADSKSPSRVVMYLQTPGCFTPPHEDWLQTFSKNLDAKEYGRRRRWWIPVDNYILGQCMMHEDYIIAHYCSGDVFPLDFNGRHCGVNASIQPRYYITFSALAN